jgi:hypothetical protein
VSDAPDEGANPLDAVFERAVKPYLSGAAIREDFPAETPVILMRKAEELPTETRELDGGGTITIPVLAALKDAKFASRSRVGTFAFDALEPDAVALLLPRATGSTAEVRIVTRASGGALLVADLDAMLGAVVALADHPALQAFPGGEFLIDALRTGLTAAKDELIATLTRPDASGKSLLDQMAEAAPDADARGKQKGRAGKPGAKRK